MFSPGSKDYTMNTVHESFWYGCVFGIAVILCFGFVNTGFAEDESMFQDDNLFNLNFG